MEQRAGAFFAASLAALGVLLLAGLYGVSPAPGGEDGTVRIGLALAGAALLCAQGLLVYRGILREASLRRAEAESLRRRLGELSGRDELTGAFNRTMLETFLGRELESVRRYDKRTSCVLLDVDGLGAINRDHGYQAGDRLLARLGHELGANLRATDGLFRWHGGRFLILVPHVGVEMAAQLAEKLRRLVERIEFGEGLRATACLAVAEVRADDSSESLMQRLRQGLRRAKADGPGRLEALRER